MTRTRIALLGATGSIGTQTLDVCRMHSDELEVVALAAGTRVAELVTSALEFGVKHIALADESTRDATELSQLGSDATVGFGAQAVADLVQLDDVDIGLIASLLLIVVS